MRHQSSLAAVLIASAALAASAQRSSPSPPAATGRLTIDTLMDINIHKKGKGDLVTFMMYPGEFHYFTREHVLEDAWRRVDQFWDRYLKSR